MRRQDAGRGAWTMRKDEGRGRVRTRSLPTAKEDAGQREMAGQGRRGRLRMRDNNERGQKMTMRDDEEDEDGGQRRGRTRTSKKTRKREVFA